MWVLINSVSGLVEETKLTYCANFSKIKRIKGPKTTLKYTLKYIGGPNQSGLGMKFKDKGLIEDQIGNFQNQGLK